MKVFLVAALVAALVGCTKKNPAVCCTTAVQCDEYGFDELTPCGGFEVCVDGECESPTCTTSADCAEPSPYCVNTVCTATCDGDASCGGTDLGAYCAPDGACVECLESEQCTDSGAAVCDSVSHACRSCTADAECASGICLASEGVCAAETEAIFVVADGVDGGDCTSAAPCETIEYGLTRVTAARPILKLLSLDIVAPDGVALAQDVYIDGSETRIQRSSAGPVVTVSGGARVTMEGVRIISTPDAIEVTASTLDLFGVELDGDVTHNGRLTIRNSDLAERVTCNGTTLEIDRSTVRTTSGVINLNSCSATITRSTLGASGSEVAVVSGVPSRVTFENNVVLRGNASSAVNLTSSTSQVTIRFNTFIATGSSQSSNAAIRCLGAAVISSNVFAWRSTAPVSADTTCETRYSVFDQDPIAGTSNTEQPYDELFVDAAGGNYHPAAASAARGASEPELVLVVDDFDGAARPLPAGTVSDSGAFEIE